MNRQTAIIATAAAALLCGCPGLAVCAWGGIFGIAGGMGGGTVTTGGVTAPLDSNTAIAYGVGALCLGIVLVLIPVGVGFFTLRKKPDGRTA